VKEKLSLLVPLMTQMNLNVLTPCQKTWLPKACQRLDAPQVSFVFSKLHVDGFAFAFTKLILEEKKVDDLGVKMRDFTYLREVNLAKNELRNFDEFLYLNYCCDLDLSKNKIKEYRFLKENPNNLCFLKVRNPV
jgi:hypothetical protein